MSIIGALQPKIKYHLGHSRYQYEDILLSDFPMEQTSNEDISQSNDTKKAMEELFQCPLCQDLYSELKLESHMLAVHGVLEWNSQEINNF